MKEQYANDPGEKLISSALARMLDNAAPKRNLWPDIQEAARLQPAKSGRRWLMPALVPTAVLGSLAVVFVVFSSLLSSPEEFPVIATADVPAASEIAALVTASIASEVPEGVSASEISRMIDSAISADKAISAAELSAAISASAGDQLTSGQVNAIVTAALADTALSDTSDNEVALAASITQAVEDTLADRAVPAEEIAAMVAASVDASEGALTRGEMADAIAAALAAQSEALTEAQIAAIVASSVQGAVDAAEGATAAALAAAATAGEALSLATLPEVVAASGSASAQLTEAEIAAIVASSVQQAVDAAEAAPAPATPDDTSTFQNSSVNPFVDTRDDHLSTFAMDVDTASYTIARRHLSEGRLPPAESVRVEEFVNYFDQHYPAPTEGAFEISVEGAPSPFGDAGLQLLRVGIQGKVIGPDERKDASLVLVIDVSGSMARENRLELVKDSVRILLDELRPGDEIGIVTYNSRARNLLEPTGVENKDAILGALQGLTPDQSTNVEEGLQFGYHMARQMNRPGRITRLILLSDGVANVGNVEAESILDRVRLYLDEGITISTVGVGMGNFNDVLLERLANDGNGNYAYIDTLAEARRIFVDNIAGTLQVIARDAKVQVDFNDEVVRRYRLLGYENREVADQDFRNNSVDAGEVGAGHSVTALYEVLLHEGATGDLATVYVRYEDPETGDFREVGRRVSSDELRTAATDASPRFLLTAAVAEFAEILRGSYWSQDSSFEDVRELAQWAAALLRGDPDVAELLRMLEQAEQIASYTPSPKVIRVEALDLASSGGYRFSPDQLTFSVGQTVEFKISSETQFHTFTVDELGIDVAVPGGQTVSFLYTFEIPGTFRLVSIPHESDGMVATIIVR